jgi:DNA-binding transcriptional regulator YiaG
MQKYTPEELAEKAALIERYNEANGFGPQNPKITKLAKQVKTQTRKPSKDPKPPRLKQTEEEYRDMLIERYKLKHLKKAEDLPAYDVTQATRYPEVLMWNTEKNIRLDAVLRRNAYAMGPQGITPTDFKRWREQYMLMSAEQMGAFLRIHRTTVERWEKGDTEIPFSVWWVMHVTLQDPEYFLTRPGFHDFYIEHVDGQAFLCSHKWPDIRCTPTDLYFNRSALNDVLSLRRELSQKEQTIDELTAENTRLRQMLKTGAVTAELQAMHEHIGELLKRVHTADVVAFPEFKEPAEVIQLKQASA